MLPSLPGAEAFLAGGPPWWFGFHSVPGLAETVLDGHEEDYLGWFLSSGAIHGIDDQVRAAFVAAYTGHARLAHGFEYYRAMPRTAEQIAQATKGRRLTVPPLAIGAQLVGAALSRQLAPISDDLTSQLIPECGHIIPLDNPKALLELAEPFLRRSV